MPTYVYRCKACEHQFETVQSMNDKPLCECPKCKGAITRLLFPVGIVFKGSGFHVNDYPSSGASGNGRKKETPKATAAGSSKETAAASTVEQSP